MNKQQLLPDKEALFFGLAWIK